MNDINNIKTYQGVNRKDASLHFEISRMENSYEKRKGKKDKPHRHDFYTIIIVQKAEGKHFVDFNEYQLTDNQVFFVSPGQVHQVIEKEQSVGYVITFSAQFLVNSNIPFSFIQDLNLFNDYGNSSPLMVEEFQLQKLLSYCDELFAFKMGNMKFKEEAFGANLKLFLIYCNNLNTVSNNNTQLIHAGYTILKNFKELVETNFYTWHSTAEYAQQLNISPDHLNRTIKSLIGKTAKEYIQIRVTIEAKRLLYFTDLSQKEIGYQLGFSEASYFSAFFKNIAKESPTSFRKNKHIGFS